MERIKKHPQLQNKAHSREIKYRLRNPGHGTVLVTALQSDRKHCFQPVISIEDCNPNNPNPNYFIQNTSNENTSSGKISAWKNS